MSYADDNTPYVIADDINGLITSLEEVTKVLFEWSENDLLKRNAEECDFFLIATFTLHLNVKNVQSPGNLNCYITWETKNRLKI